MRLVSDTAPNVVGKRMKAEALAEAAGFKKLSCREGGQFDKQHWSVEKRAQVLADAVNEKVE